MECVRLIGFLTPKKAVYVPPNNVNDVLVYSVVSCYLISLNAPWFIELWTNTVCGRKTHHRSETWPLLLFVLLKPLWVCLASSAERSLNCWSSVMQKENSNTGNKESHKCCWTIMPMKSLRNKKKIREANSGFFSCLLDFNRLFLFTTCVNGTNHGPFLISYRELCSVVRCMRPKDS
jgi:hypothetical protein